VSNFQSLTAIIAGLQSDWVTTAMRKPGWGRLSDFETRIFSDLKQLTSKQDDFRIMRQVVESTVDSKPLDSNSRTPSVISGSAKDSLSGKTKRGSGSSRPAGPSTCIPFIGILLPRPWMLNTYSILLQAFTSHGSAVSTNYLP
jgi:GDP/GTP exchange factor required for growth at low temperature